MQVQGAPVRRALVVALVGLLLGLPCLADGVAGRVVGVADGDTITILEASRHVHRIRYAGIDAPEKAQPFGQRSKQNLARLVEGRDVVAQCGKVDRYGRKVCKVLLDGVDTNLAQVQAGFAWHYRQYASEQSLGDRAAYAEAEVKARQASKGLWVDPSPVPPWDWRRREN